jgi:hypothetical protein
VSRLQLIARADGPFGFDGPASANAQQLPVRSGGSARRPPAGRDEAPPCDPSSRKAADGDAEFPREIGIGHIKAGPRKAAATVGHETDGLRSDLIVVRPSIAFKRRLTRRRRRLGSICGRVAG